jgi:AAA+ ATPase superfamily predicted ATPase
MYEDFFDSRKKRIPAKNHIRLILIENTPLSAKQIYSEVKAKSGKRISYQAVHKLIKKLVIDGSILEIDKKYKINPRWIKGGKEYFAKLERVYQKTKNRSL